MASWTVQLNGGSRFTSRTWQITYFWFETGEKSFIKGSLGSKLPVIWFGRTFVDKKRNY